MKAALHPANQTLASRTARGTHARSIRDFPPFPLRGRPTDAISCPPESTPKSTFRPIRPPVSGTSSGHFLGLNSVFSPRRKRHKIGDGSKSGMTWHARFLSRASIVWITSHVWTPGTKGFSALQGRHVLTTESVQPRRQVGGVRRQLNGQQFQEKFAHQWKRDTESISTVETGQDNLSP